MRIQNIAFIASFAFAACDSPPPAPPPAAPVANSPASQPAPKGSVGFTAPLDGAKVFTDTTVAFTVEGMRVQPAGESATANTSGHHHLIIDGEPIAAGRPVPADATHIHYGKGQTSAPCTLTPGKHTLTVQFADGNHISYGPEWSKTIHVEAIATPGKMYVAFAAPKEGAKLHGETAVKFLVEGMKLVPAGDGLDKTSGHHHLIIDGQPTPLGQVIPADDSHLHFGKAQTETKLKLAPGSHTLTLQFGDGAHMSYGPTMSETIHVEVK